MNEYNEMPFIDYLNEVDDILEAEYGIISTDTNMDIISSYQMCNQSPRECVWEITDKNGLDNLKGLYSE